MHTELVLTAVLLADHLGGCRVPPHHLQDVDIYYGQEEYSPLVHREVLGLKEAVGPKQFTGPEQAWHNAGETTQSDDEELDSETHDYPPTEHEAGANAGASAAAGGATGTRTGTGGGGATSTPNSSKRWIWQGANSDIKVHSLVKSAKQKNNPKPPASKTSKTSKPGPNGASRSTFAPAMVGTPDAAPADHGKEKEEPLSNMKKGSPEYSKAAGMIHSIAKGAIPTNARGWRSPPKGAARPVPLAGDMPLEEEKRKRKRKVDDVEGDDEDEDIIEFEFEYRQAEVAAVG